jgi:hypothetical protein
LGLGQVAGSFQHDSEEQQTFTFGKNLEECDFKFNRVYDSFRPNISLRVNGV